MYEHNRSHVLVVRLTPDEVKHLLDLVETASDVPQTIAHLDELVNIEDHLRKSLGNHLDIDNTASESWPRYGEDS